ncbi:MAG: phosphoethanolamine--lipid A transferase [Tabrizicola sp.]|jgi:lipid A ethanolaminephosphotransferase|nr:phosphoethanolamine--lipid A transferase [Tabrizicola sp.]
MTTDLQALRPDRRPVLTPLALNLIVTTYLLALCNGTFWGHLLRIFDGRLLLGAIFAGAMWSLMFLVVSLLAVRRAQRPVLIALIMIAAVSSYYADKLGVIVDREMIQNAMTTTFAESRHLITTGFLLHVGLYGVLPSVLVLLVRLRRGSILRGLGTWILSVGAAAGLIVGLLYIDLQTFMPVFREQKELLASVQPLAPIAGAVRYARMMLKSTQIVLQPTGTDAQPGPFLARADKPVLLVIVAGETARAANWSLGGYGRETNPELAKRDIVYYPQATSCGTATATSLPCMFSPLTRADYSYEGGLSNENLLDVLARVGFHVEWWDNNTGDKDIATRLFSRKMTAADGPEFCDPECTDEVFLKHLEEKAATITQNTVIVLHQIGSHGPSYWLRYPADREVFSPACQTPQLGDCSDEEIVNAYDNTIAFTDHMLATLIDRLDAQDRVVPALFYASDHGESLGENGLYLHGAPDFMAPPEQTHVPMLIWMSQRFRDTLALDQACMAAASGGAVSHDNMFSTLLGMVDVTTVARDPALDLAGACRKGATG